MSYAIGIVAHNDRFDMAYQLSRQVDADIISFDNGDLGAFGNHIQTWTQLRETCGAAQWLVVLEDDAQPVPCFASQLDAALDAAPGPVLSLYLGRTRPPQVQRPLRALIHAGLDTCWVQHDEMLHGVAIAIRADLVDSMLETIVQSPYVFEAIDTAIGMWAGTTHYAWPSLVDHADTATVIDIHPDGQPRGPIIPTDTGIPVLARRVAWKVGQRTTWDSTTTVLNV